MEFQRTVAVSGEGSSTGMGGSCCGGFLGVFLRLFLVLSPFNVQPEESAETGASCVAADPKYWFGWGRRDLVEMMGEVSNEDLVDFCCLWDHCPP